MSKKIRLFYWSSAVFEKKAKENYGDILSAYIVSKISGKETTFYNAPASRKKIFKRSYLMAIGSILQYATDRATVWGSGIISQVDTPGAATYCAVRGPLSRKRILELGHSCPEVYGDPALLLPELYNPEVLKTHDLGIIPHYVDYKRVQESYGDSLPIIDLMTDDFLATTDQILSCKAIVSSSLHGVIVAHAYGIPAIWIRFSDKLSGDNTKYADYFLSVGLEPYTAQLCTETFTASYFLDLIRQLPSLPTSKKVKEVASQLEKAFPASYKAAS